MAKDIDELVGETSENKQKQPKLSSPKDSEKRSFTERCADAWYGMLNDIYTAIYMLGLRLLRMYYKLRRRFRRFWNTRTVRARKRRDRRRRGLRSQIRSVWWELTAPIRDVRRRYRKLSSELASEKRYGTDWRVVGVYGRLAWFAVKKCWQLIRFLFNYIAPIAACVFLYLTIQGYAGETYALKLIYDDVEVGYIADESVYNQAQQDMRNRMAGEEFFTAKQATARFELVTADADELMRVDELTNLLIKASGSDLQEADGLYMESTVNGRTQMKLIGAVDDGNGLLLYLNSMLEEYRTPEMDKAATIRFVKKMSLKPGLYPDSTIRSLDEISQELGGVEKSELHYTVVTGDTPLRIAAKNGVSFDELKMLNPSVETNLHPGDTLLISQSVSRMSVKVTTIEKIEEPIEFTIKQETVPSQNIGWTSLKQKGKQGMQEIVSEVVLIDGIETSRTELNKNRLQEPVDEILQVGGNRPLTVVPKTSGGGVPSGAFAWPTVAGSVSCGFLGYYGHTGTDINWQGCYGYPILASADGVVVLAKMYGGAYGNYVIIEHGGGVQTLYAHASRLDVKVGDSVKQGQQIAAIGSTGRSTGPHVHFEIIINGTPVNAINYLTR